MPRYDLKKKNKREYNVAGIIITIMFILILAGGVYYLINMFKPLEINSITIAGDWKLAGSPTWYISFNADGNDDMSGTASSYEQFTAGDTRNHCQYTYTLERRENDFNDAVVYILTLKNTKTKQIETFKITKVSQAEMSIISGTSKFQNLTKVSVF